MATTEEKGVTVDQELEALDDGYFTGQTDGGRGGPFSAFALSKLIRSIGAVFWKLTNKHPMAGKADYSRVAGDPIGHHHNAVNSEFIGNTVLAARKGLHAYTADGEGFEHHYNWPIWSSLNIPDASFQRVAGASFDGTNYYTCPRLRFAPGCNRAEVSILAGVWVTTDGGFPVTDPKSDGREISFALFNHTTSDSVTLAHTFNAGVEWMVLTAVTKLVCQAGLNDIDIRVRHSDGAGTDVNEVRIYGIVITEARA